MYKKEDVCAVIVSYNCDEIIKENIMSLKEQVAKTLIVDNASSVDSINIINMFCNDACVVVIYNKQNEGIGRGLNQGLAYAHDNGYKLILTMDQDTILDKEAVQRMLDVINTDRTISSVGPVYQIRKNNSLRKRLYSKAAYLITSGNLTYVDKALEAGGYNEALFLDSVDFDFSLALRSNGGYLAIVHQSFMKHKIGEKETAKFLLFKFEILSHSPERHYYIYRNHVYILKKYFFKYPYLCSKKQLALIIHTLQVLLIQANKREIIALSVRGLKDGINNKFGKLTMNN